MTCTAEDNRISCSVEAPYDHWLATAGGHPEYPDGPTREDLLEMGYTEQEIDRWEEDARYPVIGQLVEAGLAEYRALCAEAGHHGRLYRNTWTRLLYCGRCGWSE